MGNWRAFQRSHQFHQFGCTTLFLKDNLFSAVFAAVVMAGAGLLTSCAIVPEDLALPRLFSSSTRAKAGSPVSTQPVKPATPEAAPQISQQAGFQPGQQRSQHCPPFETAPFYRKPSDTIVANPENWVQSIADAAPGAEVLLEDGVYKFWSYAVVIDKPLTLRGKSNNPQKVIIQGRGYGDESEGLMVMADNVQIADLTIRDVHHHGIALKRGVNNPVVYNVNLLDIGTQHIKGNGTGPNGLIACSKIGYSNPVGTGDYNGAIDLHGAVNWTIRDNYIYNIFGDGSGCVVDSECGTQFPGGGAAILVWHNSKDNIIERNTIVESFRGVLLGLNTSYSGGVVRNNFIFRKQTGKEGVNGYIAADTGISLIGANNVVVEGNTVMLAGDYPGAIEVWKATGNTIRNNMISKPVWNRGETDFKECQPDSADGCTSRGAGNIVVAFKNYLQLAFNN